jgi:DNA repair protein SbcD/Mre11
MRILHTADWHLGRILGQHSLLDDQAYILRQFVDLAVEARPDAIIIAGDLYDRSVPPADAVTLLDDTLHELTDRCAAPVIAISGNHDSQQRLDFGARLLRHRGLHLFGSVGSAGVVQVGDTAFVAAPFAEPAAVRSAFPEYAGHDHESALAFLLDRLRPATGRAVAIAHAFVAGGAESDSERPLSVGTAGQVGVRVFAGFAYAALGHLHRPQTLGNARYSGSLLKYSTSEAGQKKSVTLVDLDGGTEEFVLRPRRDLRCVTGAFDELLQGPPSDDYLFFTLLDSGLIPNAAQRLREVYPQFLGLELRKAKEAGEARAGKAASPMQMFAGFWQHVAGEEATAEQRAVVAPFLEETE